MNVSLYNATMIDPWRYARENEAHIRRVASRLCHGNPDIVEDLVGEAMVRLPRIAETYDPTRKVKFHTYATVCLRWYMSKMLRKRNKTREDDFVEEPEFLHAFDLDEEEEVSNMLEGLHWRERRAVRAKVLENLTFEEIGDEMGVAKGTARNYYLRGIAKLQSRRLGGPSVPADAGEPEG